MRPFFCALALVAACAPLPHAGPATIPEAMAGRWGLTAADCTPARGDDKGVLEIDATTLRFYESRAVLARVEERSPVSITGEFAFTGEGMAWTRRVALELEDGGRVLTRREFGADAMTGVLRYEACGG